MYVHGVTTLADWTTTIRNYPAPWGEIGSGKFVVATTSAALAKLDDPSAVCDYWDKVRGGY
jgi:hypothetical protein